MIPGVRYQHGFVRFFFFFFNMSERFEVFWMLLRGPVFFLIEYTLQSAHLIFLSLRLLLERIDFRRD